MSVFSKELENRIEHFVELQDDDIFDGWKPSEKLYNRLECCINNPSDTDSALSNAIDILCDLKDFFDNSKEV